MSGVVRVMAVLAATAGTWGLAAASGIPMRAHRSGDAALRVAFSARPERVERCRAVSAEELAEIPQHMRQSEECEGTTARYRLEVLRDGVSLTTVELRGGGLRHDRQLYVLRQLPIPSARSMVVEVRLTRIDLAGARPGTRAAEPGDPNSGDEAREEPDHDSAREADDDSSGDREARADSRDRHRREADERRRRIGAEVPPSLVLREAVTLAPREVLLVTYDQEARRLRLVRGPR